MNIRALQMNIRVLRWLVMAPASSRGSRAPELYECSSAGVYPAGDIGPGR